MAGPDPGAFQPVSISLHPHQLAWLDSRRLQQGSISRSAALRQLIEAAMAATTQATQPVQAPSRRTR
jgi:metal-responsive CopG/Arc/MetJ family transcriptional regulator